MHEGHRSRMYDKLKNGENFYDHEILEMLLFNVLPRKNTNGIAHNLLNRFPSLSATLEASIEELTAVEGVGEQTAIYLKIIGECFKRIKKTDGFCFVNNYDDLFNYARLRLYGLKYEVLEIYCLDKSNTIVRTLTYTVNDPRKVEIETSEILKMLSTIKPHGVYAAHNHVNGQASPSAKDDEFTKQMQLICSMVNAEFYDHCIIGRDGDRYSYYLDGRIDEIKKNFSIGNLLKSSR